MEAPASQPPFKQGLTRLERAATPLPYFQEPFLCTEVWKNPQKAHPDDPDDPDDPNDPNDPCGWCNTHLARRATEELHDEQVLKTHVAFQSLAF